MKKYTLSGAASFTHTPENPERTARRASGQGMNFDIVFQVWPTRQAMAKAIRKQENSPYHWSNWLAVKPLGDGEGY